MRETFLIIWFFVTFGLLVASCEADRRLGEMAEECTTFDCWE